MQVRNKTDRYRLVMAGVENAFKQGVISETERNDLIERFESKLAQHREYIIEYGEDPEEITNWVWPSHS